MILKARFVVPVDGPVIENGGVVVKDGRIAAVGNANDLTGSPATDYGDAVICPGFVNAHTHLELSLLAGRIPPGPDFIDWIRRLVAALDTEPPTRETTVAAMRVGVNASLAAGVTLIGDITRSPSWTREVLGQSPLRSVSFGEVIAVGTRRHRLAARLDAATSVQWLSQRSRAGISPHAPYTVEPQALRACAERATQADMPLCIHLAETAIEDQFTRSREGPFAAYLRGLGIWDDDIPASDCSPVELTARTGVLTSRTVVAHANYVTDEDIDIIAESGASVAYCPRTHTAFDHAPHRFREMIARGVNVCVGTDSLASNPSLSVLDELRFLRRHHPDVSADRILAMGTLHGAAALGFAREAGSLVVGKSADLAVIPLETPSSEPTWESMLESSTTPLAVFIAGTEQVD